MQRAVFTWGHWVHTNSAKMNVDEFPKLVWWRMFSESITFFCETGNEWYYCRINAKYAMLQVYNTSDICRRKFHFFFPWQFLYTLMTFLFYKWTLRCPGSLCFWLKCTLLKSTDIFALFLSIGLLSQGMKSCLELTSCCLQSMLYKAHSYSHRYSCEVDAIILWMKCTTSLVNVFIIVAAIGCWR